MDIFIAVEHQDNFVVRNRLKVVVEIKKKLFARVGLVMAGST